MKYDHPWKDGAAETEFLEDLDLSSGDEHIHVDVLKVQHHGSEHNTDANLCRRVSADHYVC